MLFFLIWTEQTWQTCSDDNTQWKFLFGWYIPRRRLESVIAKYSKYPHRCGDWQTNTHTPQNIGFMPCRLTTPRMEDNSAKSCNSRFSNRDGDKEAKLMDCSFKQRSSSMKIFSKFPTANISKLNFWIVICITKDFIWTNLKAFFSIFRFFSTLRFQIFK